MSKNSIETPTFSDPSQTMLWHANPSPTLVSLESDNHFFRIRQSHAYFRPKMDPFWTPIGKGTSPNHSIYYVFSHEASGARAPAMVFHKTLVVPVL